MLMFGKRKIKIPNEENVKKEILNILSKANKIMSITDIVVNLIDISEEYLNLSWYQVSALVKELCYDKLVERVEIDRKAYFFLEETLHISANEIKRVNCLIKKLNL